MKVPSFCFVLAVGLAICSSATLFAQEPGSDKKLAEMQSTINKLQAEMASLKAAQDAGPTAPTPTEIPSRARMAPPTEPTPAAYPPANYSPPQSGYYPPAYPPAYPQYAGPPMEPVYVQQPPVVFVEPAYCPHGGYCDGYGYGGGGAELYVGPNGWGLGVGGLQLDFFGYGGGGHGYKGNKGHKGH